MKKIIAPTTTTTIRLLGNGYKAEMTEINANLKRTVLIFIAHNGKRSTPYWFYGTNPSVERKIISLIIQWESIQTL